MCGQIRQIGYNKALSNKGLWSTEHPFHITSG